MDPMIISVAVFLGVCAMVGAVAFVMRDFGSTTAEERLAVITGKKTADSDDTGVTKDEMFREGVAGLSGMVGKLSERFGNLSMLFEQADSPIGPDAFLGISGACAAIGVIGAWAAHSPVPLYPVAGIMGLCMPLMWLLWRRKSRFKKFALQLPDALELVARALRSGHSLSSGLHVVVEEMPDPVSQEFSCVYEEQNLGVPLEQALKSMLTRMPNLDLKFFVTAVVIQRQSGGNLSEILDKIGHIIRERFKILGQVQALTGEGRISGVVLMALPIGLFFVVYHLNPEYVSILFTNELGKQMIAAAAVLQVLGAITIKKIINIKV